MRPKKIDLFYSKVMLFGEYTIIQDSMGLTIPYSRFSGELRFINKQSYTDLDQASLSNGEILRYAAYIKTLFEKGELLCHFNISRLGSDLQKGLYFESTIPEGYGLGSSGALVSALYSRYVTEDKIEAHNRLSHRQIAQLKRCFAQLESYFHGTSSGIDPLICYLRHPLFLENRETLSPIHIPRRAIQSEDAIFLINSGKPGMTAPLVRLYMDKCAQSAFFDRIINELIPLNNRCIQSLLQGEIDLFYNSVHRLSAFQLEHFTEMIPDTIRATWQQGVDSHLFTLKLCGSGGGGYMLGFTRHFSQVSAQLSGEGFEVIPVYRRR